MNTKYIVLVLVMVLSLSCRHGMAGAVGKMEVALEIVNLAGHEGHLYFEGETVAIKSRVSVPGGDGKTSLRLVYTIKDYYDQVVKTVEKKLVPAGKEPMPDTLDITPESRGMFWVLAEARYGNVTSLPAEVVFGVISKIPFESGPDEQSFFGTHARATPFELALAKKLGMKWQRFHDMGGRLTKWINVEPQRGRFVWYDRPADQPVHSGHLMEAYQSGSVERLLTNGFWILGSLDGTRTTQAAPDWTTNLSHAEYLEAWRKYVTAVVTHYKGKIKYWEVCNEPQYEQKFGLTGKRYVDLLKAAYTAAKQVDPDCRIVGGGGLNTTQFLDWKKDFFAVPDLMNYMDILSIHYGGGYDEGYLPLGEQVEMIRQDMAGHGRLKPIWDTESGACASYSSGSSCYRTHKNYMNYSGICANMARHLGEARAQGIQKSFFYWLPAALDFDSTTAKPYAVAYNTLVESLMGKEFRKTLQIKDRVRCHIFANGTKLTAIVWGQYMGAERSGLRCPLDSAGLHIVNIMGNKNRPVKGSEVIVPISREPVYVISETLAVDGLARALQAGELTSPLPPKPVTKLKGIKLEGTFDRMKNVPWENVFYVNLAPYCNMGFKDEVAGDGKGGWSDEGPNDLRDMPVGVQEFYGVKLQIVNPAENDGKSCITLFSKNTAPTFPKKVVIALNRDKVEMLYFLQASTWGGGGAKYIIRYAGGGKEEIPLSDGINIRDWWFGAGSHKVEQAKQVPIRTNPEGYMLAEDGVIRYLYLMEWVNPRVEEAITGIDFVSTATEPIPILIAITGIAKSR